MNMLKSEEPKEKETNNTYTIYMHKNKINNKCYIGVTKRDPKLRWQNGTAYRNNKHFDSAIKKYGWDNFEHIILDEKLSEQEASQKEKYYIQLYNTFDRRYGYNKTLGGEGILGYKFSEKQKEIMRQNNLGEKNPCYGRRGNLHPMYGLRGELNPNYGRKASEETCKNISNGKKGLKLSEEHKQHLKQSIKHGADSVCARKFIMKSLDGEILEYFNCGQEIVKKYGFDLSNIVSCCRHKQKTSYGYLWEYNDEP